MRAEAPSRGPTLRDSGSADSLLPVEAARRILLEHGLKPVRAEVPLREAVGFVLARPAKADRDIPPFDRAAVDGFAVRLAGPWTEGLEFRLLGQVAAGSAWEGTLPRGCAVQVMTGAPVPKGADGVVMVERSERPAPDRVRLFGAWQQRGGIAPRGEDARRGTVVLEAGTLCAPQHVPALASIGCAQVSVFARPRVALLTTGAEIVDPARTPGPHQIRNTNGPQLEALLRREGFAPERPWRSVRDDLPALRRAISGHADAEVLVLTGGVSAGELDFVPEALRLEGYSVLFHKLAMRPGKPLLFGVRSRRRRVVFALPGNPVSVLVTAWEYLLPYLRAAAGFSDPGPARLRARARSAIERKPGLAHFVLARLEAGEDGRLTAGAVRSNGSGDYLSAVRANALITLPSERPVLAEGEECWVHPLTPGYMTFPEET